MLERGLVDKLHEAKIIDKRSVLWWQLGFEGRKVMSDAEFAQNLREIKYESLTSEFMRALDKASVFSLQKPKPEDYYECSIKVWIKHDVPILIRDVEIEGFTISAFITIKPMSHSPDGWSSLRSAIESQLPPIFSGMAYEEPHIRGIAIETTNDFLFWYPFLFGDRSRIYNSSIVPLGSVETPIIVDPIHPDKFCTNLIEKEWKGKRAQRKPLSFDLGSRFEFVPYFNFDASKPNATIYPLPLIEGNLKKLTKNMLKENPDWTSGQAESFIKYMEDTGRLKVRKPLDLPTILMSSGNGKVHILGTGYSPGYEEACYWPLDEKKHSLAKNSLRDRLGLEAESFDA